MGKLVKIETDLVVKNAKDISELLKPLSRDIYLFTTKIGGTYKVKDKQPLLSLKVNDRLNFKISSSKYEENQISILNTSHELIGYVPEQDSVIFFRLMEAGKMLYAITKNISITSSVPLVDIDIFLKDY